MTSPLLRSRLLERLRRETSDSHQALDQSLDALNESASAATRDNFVLRYCGFYREVMCGIGRHLLDVSEVAEALAIRAKVIEKDLDSLGLTNSKHEIPSFHLQTPYEALGALYVIEGSNLGGQFILKELSNRGCSLNGLRFLNPYGDELGKRWRSFPLMLDREVPAQEVAIQGVVRGAQSAFAFARSCLFREKA